MYDLFPIGPIAAIQALAVATIAGMLRGSTGFGSSLILAPLLSHVFGPVEAVALSLLMGISAAAFMIPSHIDDVDLPVVGTVALAGLICAVPGVFLLRLLDAGSMRMMIAGTTVAAAALLLVAPRLHMPSGLWPSLFAGALGGFAMGATSVGGPPLGLYLVGSNDPTIRKLANIILVVGLVETAALLLLLATGSLTVEILLICLLLLPLFFAGIVAGRRLFVAASDRYRPFVLVTMMLIGAALLLT